MRGLASAAIVTAAGAALLGAGPAAASSPAAAPTWTVVSSPPSDGGFFNAVSARADTDAWAVGDLSATTPLTARWNGTAWSQVPGPAVTGARNTVLNAVSAASATDAWAVGRATVSLVTSSLAAHWNGTAWSVVQTPEVWGSVLTSVVDISHSDAYAVGESEALHWNGTAWSAFGVPVPGGGTPAGLSAVAADGANDVWIVGQYGTGSQNVTAAGHNTTVNGPTAAIILAWNGSAWAKVNVPKVGATEQLDSAAAAPGGKITWAFGRSTDSSGVVSNLTMRNG
jgi:hypothetical protein